MSFLFGMPVVLVVSAAVHVVMFGQMRFAESSSDRSFSTTWLAYVYLLRSFIPGSKRIIVPTVVVSRGNVGGVHEAGQRASRAHRVGTHA